MGIVAILAKRSPPFEQIFQPTIGRMLKFDWNWPSGFRGEVIWKKLTTPTAPTTQTTPITDDGPLSVPQAPLEPLALVS